MSRQSSNLPAASCKGNQGRASESQRAHCARIPFVGLGSVPTGVLSDHCASRPCPIAPAQCRSRGLSFPRTSGPPTPWSRHFCCAESRPSRLKALSVLNHCTVFAVKCEAHISASRVAYQGQQWVKWPNSLLLPVDCNCYERARHVGSMNEKCSRARGTTINCAPSSFALCCSKEYGGVQSSSTAH